jgi:hypothetical protein
VKYTPAIPPPTTTTRATSSVNRNILSLAVLSLGPNDLPIGKRRAKRRLAPFPQLIFL